MRTVVAGGEAAPGLGGLSRLEFRRPGAFCRARRSTSTFAFGASVRNHGWQGKPRRSVHLPQLHDATCAYQMTSVFDHSSAGHFTKVTSGWRDVLSENEEPPALSVHFLPPLDPIRKIPADTAWPDEGPIMTERYESLPRQTATPPLDQPGFSSFGPYFL